jgi:hypothetical protein
MAKERPPVSHAEAVKPARSDDAKMTGGGEEIRLADLAARKKTGATRGEGGTPGATNPGPTATTGEPWTDAERARRR